MKRLYANHRIRNNITDFQAKTRDHQSENQAPVILTNNGHKVYYFFYTHKMTAIEHCQAISGKTSPV